MMLDRRAELSSKTEKKLLYASMKRKYCAREFGPKLVFAARICWSKPFNAGTAAGCASCSFFRGVKVACSIDAAASRSMYSLESTSAL